MADIDIEILADGSVKIGVRGAKSSECLDHTRFLEEAIGEVESRELTAEYYETADKDRDTVAVGGPED